MFWLGHLINLNLKWSLIGLYCQLVISFLVVFVALLCYFFYAISLWHENFLCFMLGFLFLYIVYFFSFVITTADPIHQLVPLLNRKKQPFWDTHSSLYVVFLAIFTSLPTIQSFFSCSNMKIIFRSETEILRLIWWSSG